MHCFLSRGVGVGRRLRPRQFLGESMNFGPSFGILAVLYIVVMAVMIGLAIYVLVLVITFLRLRIVELKRAAPPKGSSGQP